MSKNANDIVIVGYARTAFDKFGGVTRDMPSPVLTEKVIRELVKRTGIDSEVINDVNLGQCMLMEAGVQTDITARQGLIMAGLNQGTLSNTMDRACCSSTTALQTSYRNLMLGEADVSLALGVDNMSRVPLYVPPKYRWEGTRLGNIKIMDSLSELGIPGFSVMAVDAGIVAEEFGVTREMQDEWALGSHYKYYNGPAKGNFDNEIFALEVPQGKKPSVILDKDQSPRTNSSMEVLAKLPTIYGSPTVTAGNAPGLSTGATGLMVTTRKKAEELGLKPLATILKVVSFAMDYKRIAEAPAPAIQKGLKETGLKLEDIKVIEINEAFAAMPLVTTQILGDNDPVKIKKLRNITNVDGGAIALGHPVGASGLRITMHALNELRRQGGGYGVACICGGLAQSDAVMLKVE